MKLKRYYPYLLIGLIAAIAYLPFLGKQGFYRDDWYQIWAGTTQGCSTLIRMFSIDRPGLGFMYAITHRILGSELVYWHLCTFLVRIALSFLIYHLVKRVLPDHDLPAFLTAVLVTIYPGFLEQPFADTSLSLYLAYFFCVASVYFSMLAFHSEKKWSRISFTLLALVFGFFYLFVFEYFIGMEIVRIYLLWRAQKKKNQSKPFFPAFLKQVVPYAGMLLVFLVWRLLIFKSARSTTDIQSVIRLYQAAPFEMIFTTLKEFLSGVYNSIVQAWAIPIYTLSMRLSAAEFVLALTGSCAAAFLIYWVLKKSAIADNNLSLWGKDALKIGLVLVVSTVLPLVLLNRKVNYDNAYVHYTFPLMLGAVLIVVGLVYSCVANKKARTFLFSGLTFIAVFTQLANGVHFQKHWEMQRNLWWQLTWRAPDIKDDTTLVVLTPAAYRLQEAYEIWAPANLIYNQSEEPIRISAEVPNDQTIPMMIWQDSYGEELRRIAYVVDFKQMLAVSAPHAGSCLHVFDGEDLEISSREELQTHLVAPFSNSSLIDVQQASHTPSTAIFGREPAHDWCYYYQKAALARQQEDWQTIVALGSQVMERNLQPSDLSEWMPFYEGYARAGQMDLANETGALIRQDAGFIASYCDAHPSEELLEADTISQFLVNNLCGSAE
jgi:hypothetical protein